MTEYVVLHVLMHHRQEPYLRRVSAYGGGRRNPRAGRARIFGPGS